MRLYDNSRTVNDEAAILNDFQQRSSQAYAQHPHRTIVYGKHPRECIDVFESDVEQAPLLVFIHGGYWQWCDKTDFGWVIANPLAMDMDVALVEYPLTPEVSFEQLVDSVGKALDALAQQDSWHNRPVYLCGHSAGGHLSAYWQNHALVDGIIAISGLYDLAPIADTHLNEALQLSKSDMLTYSPVLHTDSHKPIHIVYGLQELAELQWQSTHYAQVLSKHNPNVHLHALDANHYNILDRVFTESNGLLSQYLQA